MAEPRVRADIWRRLLAVLVVLLGCALGRANSAQALTKLASENMGGLVQWVYHNGATEDPEPCESVCSALWSKEKAGHLPAAVWNTLADRVMFQTEMWGSLSGRSVYRSLKSTPSRLGVLFESYASEADDKWVWVREPAAARGEGCLESAATLWGPGATFTPSGPAISEPSWLAKGCNLGENGINRWAPEAPSGGGCPTPEQPAGLADGEWMEEDWLWNECWARPEESTEEMSYAQYEQGLFSPVDFGPTEPYEHQYFEYWRIPVTGSAPSVATLEALLEHALAEPVFAAWVEWALSGGEGPEPDSSPGPASQEGLEGEPSPGCDSAGSKSVNCASGNELITETDLLVGGRGPGLSVTRSYNSLAAVAASSPGPFGYGWSGPYTAHVEVNATAKMATVITNSGTNFVFDEIEGRWIPAAGSGVRSTLRQEGEDLLFTEADRPVLRFGTEGKLLSIADRNGNTITMHWSGAQLESASDEAGRSITFKYEGGRITEAKDPMGHTVKYSYNEAKTELTSVTEPGETSPNWTYEYNTERELTKQTDARKGTIEREYDSSHRVKSETDQMHHTRTWEYSAPFGTEGETTTITEPNGSKTVEIFNADGEPTEITRAYGTSLTATTHDAYNTEGELVGTTDADGHNTAYTYDATGDRTSETTPTRAKTEWEYNSAHEVVGETSPLGEKTTIERDSHGNATEVSRPAPHAETEVTKYTYDSHGDVESMEDARKHTWHYEYDSYGDRAGETDPEGNKTTWEYDKDSNVIASVSARGHEKGAKESSFKTTIERDEQERPVKITDPLKHTTKYKYDAAGNLEKLTDGNEHTTTYSYNADNELTKTEEPSGIVTETGYDSESQVTSQTNGLKGTTEYVRNALEEVTEEIDPRHRKTTHEYDTAGNLKSTTDPLKRTTSYSYTPDNQISEITYSGGKTHSVSYTYNAVGQVTQMVDGSGKSTYSYDQLGRLEQSVDGHGDTVKYEYNLVNEPTKMTYPNGKTIVRSYDNDERLQSVKDWEERTTSFEYNADSDLAAIVFPSASGDKDLYNYDDADQMSGIEMLKGSETLASLSYKRDDDGQVTSETQTGLPGEAKPAYKYDEDDRLTKGGGTKYEYDAANDITGIGSTKNSYTEDDEIAVAGSTVYVFNEDGQRTERSTGVTEPHTKYSYDEPGDLTGVSREKSGETPAIEDTYTYNGEGLRTAQDINGTTAYLTWEIAAELPLILNDSTNSYVYGPDDMAVEQINNTTGAVTYLHHDQAGSTRLLTGSTGKVEGSYGYSAYGTPEHTGTATTPLGYDGEYTSPDTGLIYLRHRVYDPSTAQFLSVDPLEMYTGAPYNYAGDNPLNYGDPRGLAGESIGEAPSCPPGICFPFPNRQETERAIEAAKEFGHQIGHTASEVGHGIESVWNEVTGEGESSNESTQTEQSSECGELRFNGDQDALIKIAKEAQRNGLSPEDAEALREWAEEYDVPFRGPEEHPTRGFGSQPHVHVGPVDHIPVG
jgi:RHS repeat-associated protein